MQSRCATKARIDPRRALNAGSKLASSERDLDDDLVAIEKTLRAIAAP